MTIREAISSNSTFVNVPPNAIGMAAINRGVDIEGDYSASDLESLELISADIYLALATQPEFREGELSIKYDRDILMRRARNIYAKYGDDKLEETGYTKIELNITKVQ